MKKLISITLSIAIAMSVCSTSIYAFLPMDFHDQKCIDLSKLCTHDKKCEPFYKKQDNVCKCKKCSVAAYPYIRLKEYILDLLYGLTPIDKMVYENMQTSIDYEAKKYGMLNVIFVTDGIGALVFRKSENFFAAVATYTAMACESVVSFIFHERQRYYETLSIENEVKLNKDKKILESISDEINRKAYKNKNFLLASTNYDPNSPTSTAFFAKKDNIFYNDSYINDEYFNELNENIIKPILARIKNGEFSTHKNHEYDTELRDLMKKGLKITMPIALFAETVDLLGLNTTEALQKAKEHLIGKVDKEKVDAVLKAISKMVKDGFNLKSLSSLDTDTVDLLIRN